MTETILIGSGREIEEIPRAEWEAQLEPAGESTNSRLAFMTEDHHRVRRLAVLDLARRGQPLAPRHFSEQLGLEEDRVVSILDELERNLFFLVRNDAGAVTWAYPVTVDRTPHRLTFSTGERLHGA
jgi:hypothetical protein